MYHLLKAFLLNFCNDITKEPVIEQDFRQQILLKKMILMFLIKMISSCKRFCLKSLRNAPKDLFHLLGAPGVIHHGDMPLPLCPSLP
jgi:hypothetical protein